MVKLTENMTGLTGLSMIAWLQQNPWKVLRQGTFELWIERDCTGATLARSSSASCIEHTISSSRVIERSIREPDIGWRPV